LADEIADILALREIPFHVVTGYSEPPPTRYKNVEVLHKPFQLNDLRLAVEGMLVKSVSRRSPYGGAYGHGTVAHKAVGRFTADIPSEKA
jgi:hypothetical protein